MRWLRKILLLAFVAVFVAVAIVFAYGNRQLVAIDLGFVRLENVSLAVAFVCAFGIGTLFGMACALVAFLKAIGEKKILQRRLAYAESEIGRLRNAPLEHAD